MYSSCSEVRDKRRSHKTLLIRTLAVVVVVVIVVFLSMADSNSICAFAYYSDFVCTLKARFCQANPALCLDDYHRVFVGDHTVNFVVYQLENYNTLLLQAAFIHKPYQASFQFARVTGGTRVDVLNAKSAPVCQVRLTWRDSATSLWLHRAQVILSIALTLALILAAACFTVNFVRYFFSTDAATKTHALQRSFQSVASMFHSLLALAVRAVATVFGWCSSLFRHTKNALGRALLEDYYSRNATVQCDHNSELLGTCTPK